MLPGPQNRHKPRRRGEAPHRQTPWGARCRLEPSCVLRPRQVHPQWTLTISMVMAPNLLNIPHPNHRCRGKTVHLLSCCPTAQKRHTLQQITREPWRLLNQRNLVRGVIPCQLQIPRAGVLHRPGHRILAHGCSRETLLYLNPRRTQARVLSSSAFPGGIPLPRVQ